MSTRAEHLAFCKQRALRDLDYYLEHEPDQACVNAWASMASDLGKHPETANHKGIELGLALMMGDQLNTPEKMRRFIEGFG